MSEPQIRQAGGEVRPPLPPFTAETAALKARRAEDAWNSRDPERVRWVIEQAGEQAAARKLVRKRKK